MTERTKKLRTHKQRVTARGKPLPSPPVVELFGLIESLLEKMDSTGTFECGFQVEFRGGYVEVNACRHRFDMGCCEPEQLDT